MTSLVTTRRKGGVLVWSRVIETSRVRNTLGERERKDLLAENKNPQIRIWGFLFSPYVSTVVTGVFKVVVSAGYLEKMSLTIFENEENQGMLENNFQWLKVRLYQYV